MQDGAYDLCFIMNPLEVVQEGVEPDFLSVPLQKGDVYLLDEDWLQYPHAAIPRKGATELKRKVLLIGGQYFPSFNNLPKCPVDGDGFFYHYKDTEGGPRHVLPANAISGQHARAVLDSRTRICKAYNCERALCEGEDTVTCRVCRQLVHAFVPQQGVLERYESTSTAPKRQCSYNVEVQGARLHECFQCKLNVDQSIADGSLAERAVIGIPCCTCSKDCLGDTICFHCKLFVHDGKCSRKMQLLEGSEDKPGEGQCTMCRSCAQMASRKRTHRSRAKSDPKALSAGKSTGVGPASTPSTQLPKALDAGSSTGIGPASFGNRQLRSSPSKKPINETTEKSKTAPDESKETSTEKTEQAKTSAKRKADESTNAGTKHCKFIPTDMSCFFS